MLAFAAFPDDSSFLKTLAEGGTVEVEAGELAANKGVSDDVQKFGMMMAKDHGAANQKIATIAKAKGRGAADHLQRRKNGDAEPAAQPRRARVSTRNTSRTW